MKLNGDFFKVLAQESLENGFRCQVSLNAEHTIYQAHFPGNPITPGVCLLQIATELLEQHEGVRLQLHTADAIKFRKPVTPDMRPTFVFTGLNHEAGILAVIVSVEDEDKSPIAKMSLKFNVIDK